MSIRIAFSTLGCPDWTVEQACQAARRHGYDGITLRLLDGEIVPATLNRDGRERVRAALGDLSLASIDTSCTFTSPDDAVRARMRADAVRYLEMAADLTAPLIRVFGGRLAEGDNEAAARDRIVDSLNLLSPRAETLGIGIALETHDSLSASRAVADVLARVPSHSVGALWDVHHPIRSGESPSETYDLIGARTIATHVKDARRVSDGWQLVLMDEGELPIAEFIRVLRARGWHGWLAVEWEKKWHPEIPEPDVAMPWHAERLRRLLAT